MRATRLFKARKDVVDMLLRYGRLADMQLLNFYNMDLERECTRKAAAAVAAAVPAAKAPIATPSAPIKDTAAVAAAATAAAATPAATKVADAPDASSAATQKIEAVEVEAVVASNGTLPSIDTVASLAALEVTREARRTALSDLRGRLDTVRQTALEKGPLEWLGTAYGTDTWTSSCLSKHSAKAHRLSPGSAKVKVNGVSWVSGGPGTKPTAARVVVNLAEKPDPSTAAGAAGAPFTAVVAVVKLNQSGVTSKTLNGLMRLEFSDAEATIAADELHPSELAASQHLMNAAAYSGMLAKLEEVCARHATHAVRYDGLLIRNPAVQMRLSQLACFRYAIDSLAAYVLGDGEIDGEDEKKLLSRARKAVVDARNGDANAAAADNESARNAPPTRAEVDDANAIALKVASKYRRLDVPLLESMVLNMYAETALMDGLDGAWALVRDTPLNKAVPHRSNPAKTIDYPYIQSLFDAPKYALTSNDGSLEMQAQEFLSPLLRDAKRSSGAAGVSGASSNPLLAVAEWANGLVGLSTAGQVRLAAPHVNLKVASAALEDDVATLLRLVREQTDLKDPVFIIAVGQYLSEVFANLAVLYRCTAALNYDEDGKGHREWLLTQAFCASSKVRRTRIMNDLQTAKAASKVLSKAADLDNYCTHPIELMNAAPRKSSKKGEKGDDTDAKADA